MKNTKQFYDLEVEFILSDKDRTSLKLYDRALRHQIKMLNKESP
tara:strand:- start:13453 stop:13584 length:132 start_codon:yes stop_codon:yes gene_type:complete